MTEKVRVLCAECAEETKELERGGGAKVLSCKPIPRDPGFCTLEYELIPTAGTGGAKTRAAVRGKKKK